ncbi:MAG TPA: hypothetical protein VF184_02815 [Phycisphaeraceae bacterium]
MPEWITLTNLVLLAGLLHFCQIPAMLAAPRMLGWKEDLAKLAVINRRIVQVIGIAIVIVGVGLGIVVVCAPADVAGGSRAGMGLACFLGVFWGYRAAVQYLLYHRIWPRGVVGRLSHYGLCGLFTFQSVVYLAAFLAGLGG